MKINILALDSASRICSVSVLQAQGGDIEIHSAQHSGSTQHAEHILPLIEQTLSTANVSKQSLQTIAFAQGPGGFTGLRVACGVTQGLAYALGVKVVPVPSLLAIAAQQTLLVDQNPIELVVIDARMQELYLGAYQRTAAGWYSLHKPVLIGLSQLYDYISRLQDQLRDLGLATVIRVSGDALEVFEGLVDKLTTLSVLVGNTDLARSETIARLGLLAYEQGRLTEPALAAPLYVRNRVAFTIIERETGLGGNPSANWQSVKIRPMLSTDVEKVAQIEAKLQINPWTATQFLSSLAAAHWAWVATFEDEVVAYAVLMSTGTECELLLIGVAAKHQRQGIAQQLLSYAEQHARAQGCAKVHLEVRESNSVALELYQSAGYDLVGLRKNYYPLVNAEREHAALYTKTIA